MRILGTFCHCVSNYLITGHFGGSVRNVASHGMAASHSEHCPFLGHMTCLAYQSTAAPLPAVARLSFTLMVFLPPLGKIWAKQAHLFSAHSFLKMSLSILQWMPPKLKAKKGNAPTLSKKGKSVFKERTASCLLHY